jgi:hypothetical protein
VFGSTKLNAALFLSYRLIITKLVMARSRTDGGSTTRFTNLVDLSFVRFPVLPPYTIFSRGKRDEVFDSGESNAERLLGYLSEKEGVKTSVMQLAQKYHGITILWEHRYYGKSVPFIPDDVDVCCLVSLKDRS